MTGVQSKIGLMYPRPSYKPTRFRVTWLALAVRQSVIPLLLAMCLTVPVSWAAPIATNTALPVSAGEIIVREQLVTTHSSDSLGGMKRQVDRFEDRRLGRRLGLEEVDGAPGTDQRGGGRGGRQTPVLVYRRKGGFRHGSRRKPGGYAQAGLSYAPRRRKIDFR